MRGKGVKPTDLSQNILVVPPFNSGEHHDLDLILINAAAPYTAD